MATRRNLCKQTIVAGAAGAAVLARFLCNDLAGSTGPGWFIVEAYDSDNAGTKRRIPTGGAGLDSNMDNAAFAGGTAFSWATSTAAVNTMAAGDWIVLQSAGSNPFQLLIRVASTTTYGVLLMPLGGFATGGADISPPTFPTPSVGASSGVVQVHTVPLAASYLSVVADEDMVSFWVDDLVNQATWCYVGALDGARSFMVPTDDRPYVITKLDVAYFNNASPQYCRVSPLDDTTVLTAGNNCLVFAASSGFNAAVTAGGDGLGGGYAMLPVGVLFSTASHVHFAGWLRYCGTAHLSLGASGTMNLKAIAYRNTLTATNAGIAMLWDGVTSYP